MADPDSPTDAPLPNGQVFAFIARQWLRRPRMMAAAALLTVASVACDMAVPWAAGALVDVVSRPPQAGHGAAWQAWGVFVGLYVLFFVLRNTGYFVWIPFAARNMEALTNDAFARVQSFSSQWHGDTFAGATVRRVTRAMWGYDTVSDQVTIFLGPGVLVLVGLSVTMMLRWPLIGGFALAVVGLYMALSLWMAQAWVRPANLRSAAKDSEIGAVLSDSLTSNASVKSYGAEVRELARFAAVTAAWRDAAMAAWVRGTQSWLVQNAVLVLLQAGLTGLLLMAWARGRAGPGDVAFAITAYMLMSGYLRNFGENVRNLQKALDDTEAVARFMRTPPQVRDAESAPALVIGAGEIVLDAATFGYKAGEPPLYRDLSLRIAPGERVALVGATGSGKSTFVKLIQRLYDLDGGAIRIDGQDIAGVTQASLRQAIAVVPQDPALFHRTIGENIAYGRPGASQDEIVEAARKARAHDFIARLPQGYDTLVGERGVKLSGGERQRVAIARAFLADAPILVLDEATSSLDVETEQLVQAGAEALMSGRTTIVIAHRLSTVRHADRILVFDHGRVVEEGSHRALVARGGAYARLHAVAEGTA